jgi:diguanylate cyclase (GGDEF)-like protein
MANSISIDKVLNCPTLPSLPSVAVDVLALTSKRNVNLNEIARVVQNDQALATKILRTINSSYYGLSKPCPTITRAITYLGLSTVKSLVLGFSLVDSTRGQGGFDLEPYWRRAVYSAAAARRIAAMADCCDPEEAFIAALMQDIGMPAIHASLGAKYQAILGQAGDMHESLAPAEMKEFGFNHAIVGARLGERWRLPEALNTAILHHHAPDGAPQVHQAFVRVVALGTLAGAALTSKNAGPALTRLRNVAAKWFDLQVDQTRALLNEITEDAREVGRLFRVPTGEAPDINQILEQAQEATLRHQFDVQREAETLRQTNNDLARMALTDALTGAGNRNFFDTELHRAFTQCRAAGSGIAVIMVDADRFKALNDTYGHQTGDAVLIEIAWRMKKAASGEGVADKGAAPLVCRYGGEEFAIVVPAATRRGAAQLAESVRANIAGASVARATPGPASSVPVTVSVGVAVLEPGVPSSLTTPELLVQAADRALYAAKGAGRNCVRVFTERAGAPAVA